MADRILIGIACYILGAIAGVAMIALAAAAKKGDE